MSKNIFKINPQKTKALLFDWDGTVIKSEEINYQAWLETFKEFELEYLSFEEYFKNHAPLKAEQIAILENTRLNINLDVNEIVLKKRARYKQLLRKTKLAVNLGVKELLKKAKKQNFKIAIVTINYRKYVEVSLAKNRLEKYFDLLICFEDVKKSKPHPEGYLLAAKRLEVLPAECLVFEDSYHGVTAAINAGMDFIAVNSVVPKKTFLDLDPNAKVIKDFTEVQIS